MTRDSIWQGLAKDVLSDYGYFIISNAKGVFTEKRASTALLIYPSSTADISAKSLLKSSKLH